MTQDFSRRLAIVVRRDEGIEPWQITNTIAHIAGRLGHDINEYTTGENFVSKDKVLIPRNSQYPIIVFQTDSIERLRGFLAEVRATGFPYIGYVREMIDFEDDAELQAALDKKNDAEIEYLGVGVFGDNEVLKKLTKKFSLWK